MGALKTSVAWWCFAPAMGAEGLVRAAAELGYAGIEFAPEEEWGRVTGAGLTLAAIGGHASLTDGLNRRQNHDRIEGEILANLALAQQWGIRNLICFSGNRGGQDDAAGAEATAAGLRRVAGAAEEAGVTLVLELLNSRVDHPDYQCDRTEWGVGVVDAVGSPRVKLLYDVYHMQIMEGDVIRTIETHHDRFGHYHVAGNPGRHEPDATQELHYPAIYRAIAETGDDGFVGMEFVPAGEPRAALAAALRQIRTGSAPVPG
ncbi:MAG: Hydroxypyruvate isomerase [uncultured Thermomicrobiales bacterium]|uniref:Hydroxypyruvate isomerase n=1 Tax=uncultured Thermomicrobiales bacterium TaxID=1645740 RepID=A0A6J4URP9_9BACT|nr:MAG: Hydroxypyruvate isomerase [uncultured Thermomicrobiales bacterium]